MSDAISFLFACSAGLNAALFYSEPNPWSVAGIVTSVLLFVWQIR